jgi:hypothetical protein
MKSKSTNKSPPELTKLVLNEKEWLEFHRVLDSAESSPKPKLQKILDEQSTLFGSKTADENHKTKLRDLLLEGASSPPATVADKDYFEKLRKRAV